MRSRAPRASKGGKEIRFDKSIFRLCGGELIFNSGDWTGRGSQRRWQADSIARVHALPIDRRAAGGLSTLVIELRSGDRELVIARAAMKKIAELAGQLNEALKIPPLPPVQVEPTPASLAAAQRRASAASWLQEAPLPAEPTSRRLEYSPDPKKQLILEHTPGRLRVFIPALRPKDLLVTPVSIAIGAITGMAVFLEVMFSAQTHVLVPTLFLWFIGLAILLATDARRCLRRVVITVTKDELLRTTWSPFGSREDSWPAASVLEVSVEARHAVVARFERPQSITLTQTPNAQDAESLVRHLRLALGLDSADSAREK